MYFSRLQVYRVVRCVIKRGHDLKMVWIPGQARNDGL
jgi:hypothetical protein